MVNKTFFLSAPHFNFLLKFLIKIGPLQQQQNVNLICPTSNYAEAILYRASAYFKLGRKILDGMKKTLFEAE